MKLPKSLTTVTPLSKAFALILFITLPFLGFYLGLTYQQSSSVPNEPVACTQEAKICPDGTTVGRVGPNCEFASCPAQKKEQTKTCGGWDTSGEVICKCSGKIVKSVCPTNAVCDSGVYTCEGKCGDCCYKGIAQNEKYPKCVE